MDLEDLRVFVAVAEQGSFQAAARSLRAPRTTLQRQVARLEHAVGTALLLRDERGVRPTDAGMALMESAPALLEQSRAVIEQALATGSEPRGRVRIAEATGLPVFVRTQALAMMRMAHAELDVELAEMDDPVSALRDGFDVAVHFGEAPQQGEWISRVARRTPLQLGASPSWLAAHGIPASVEALHDHTLLSWAHPSLDPRLWPLEDGGTVRVAPWLTSSSPALIRELVAAGHGVGLFPHASLDPTLDDAIQPVLAGLVGRTEVLRVTAVRPSQANPRIRGVMQGLEVLLANLPEA